MAKRSASSASKRTSVEAHRHRASRVNIPTEELRDFVAEAEKEPGKLLYPRDPSLDPQLVWKKEGVRGWLGSLKRLRQSAKHLAS